MKINQKHSTENCHFYICEKSLYVAWACFHNGIRVREPGLFYIDHGDLDAFGDLMHQ